MNRFERNITQSGEAKLRYLDGELQILSPGGFVRCAATGQPIAVEELRYWSVELQEPYCNAEAALKRFLQVRSEQAKGK
ncbi:MAG: DUF2093 domain-containing protein [Alphaproteobacteria bacterium]